MMKRSAFVTIVVTLGIMAGCAGNRDLIKRMSTSTRQDMFQEVIEAGAPAPGYADLRIYSSLKTHKPGFYSEKDIHGKPDYKLLLNIDGQAVELLGATRTENSEARSLRDPEAGEGIRYQFTKKLRLKAGTHKVVIAIPADDLAVGREITLTEGSNNLTLEPIYGGTSGKQCPGFYGISSFKEGIKWFRLVLNGKTL